MKTPQKKTIDGVTFEVTPLGSTAARKTFVRVAKALGPSLALLAEQATTLKSIRLAQVVIAALERVSDEDLEWLQGIMGEATRFSTGDKSKWPYLTEANIESLFQGRLSLYFQWLWFALEVNFSDFLGPIRGLFGGAPEVETQTASPE